MKPESVAIRKHEYGLSDTTLFILWRTAVKTKWGNKCAICGGYGPSETHHIIKRRYKLLRFDWQNGLPVHAGECHERANLEAPRLIPEWQYKYLCKRQRIIFKQYLLSEGITENEWRQRVKEELKEVINGNNWEP